MPCRIVVLSLVLLCASCAIAEPSALETLGGADWLLHAWTAKNARPASRP